MTVLVGLHWSRAGRYFVIAGMGGAAETIYSFLIDAVNIYCREETLYVAFLVRCPLGSTPSPTRWQVGLTIDDEPSIAGAAIDG